MFLDSNQIGLGYALFICVLVCCVSVSITGFCVLVSITGACVHYWLYLCACVHYWFKSISLNAGLNPFTRTSITLTSTCNLIGLKSIQNKVRF